MDQPSKYASSTIKKVFFIGVLTLSILAIAAIFFFNRKKTQQDNQAYAKYIESYTSGTISKNSFVRIHLANAVTGMKDLNKAETRELFDFSPSISGKTFWIDPQTIEFRPDKPLKSGKTYDGTFKLSEVLTTEKGLEDFNFEFRIIKPGLAFTQSGLVSQNNTSLEYMKLMGEVTTSDAEEIQAIEKTISIDFSEKLTIKWQHDPSKHVSKFTIDSIKKQATDQTLKLKWDGNAIDASQKGEEEIRVPALNKFEVLSIRAVQDEEDYALVQFSEPIGVGQDLNGMITLGNLSDLRYTIDGSQVKVYAAEELKGDYAVKVIAGIENINQKKLTESKTANLIFEDKMPAVTISGAGTILPNSGKLVLPFDAINLKAVDVTVIKIYENNIPQFFQTNSYNDGNELRRVAKPLLQKTVRLDVDKSINLHKKNRFSLDLDKLIRTEPGAMYRVSIAFRADYNAFSCKIEKPDKGADKAYNNSYGGDSYGDKIDEDDEFWQRYNDYYPRNYRWDQREDPCTPSYYTSDKWASRNLIASNIGLVAKRGNDNSMFIVATDLLTAKPLSSINFDLMDYQKQIIYSGKTDGDGFAKFDLKKTPFLLIAKNGAERGYLKLDDGNSLPLSRFNVGGDMVQNGLKGFIYGERGVWRPGDSVFVSFMLEDKLKKLPDNYPVSMEFYNPKGQLYKRLMNAKPLNGFYTFKTATENTSPTGNWLAKIKAGGATFSKTIKIETVMPNRLKINFDIGNKPYLTSGISTATLSAKWLFGADAQKLKAKVDVNLNTTETKFKGFDGYSFDNPTVSFQSQVKTIFEGSLNANGESTINTNLDQNATAPGVLKANFTTKVFEPGGNFSIDYLSVPYHMYKNYLGLKAPEGNKLTEMLVTGKNHKVDIVNVNTDGKLLSGSKTIQVELYKTQWRWWWEQDNQYTYANFTQNKYNKLIETKKVTLTNGKGSYNLKVDEPNWGRYLILVRSLDGGHVTGTSVYIDWPGWQQREQGSNPTEAAMLSFTANKEKFKVGEDITLTMPSSKNGRALISLENGTHVVKTFWVDTKAGETQFTFKAEKEMSPNVFANVTMLQPHAQTINDLPIRMYGAIPLLIEDPQTILKPMIKMLDKI
ncbi:MAG: hypothetical protein H7325_12835, partial [Pedobacter sp.]|nr:hypothetical protein [Pedobacter sp.]